MVEKEPRAKPPDGVEDGDLVPASGHASPLSLLVLGVLVAVGLSGLAGGRRGESVVRNRAGEFYLLSPRILRNGEVFETRIRLLTHAPLAKLVVGFEPELWRELTTNSVLPTPADESFEGGLLRFAFGGLRGGEPFELQIAQQVNPSLEGSNRGRVVVFDDQVPLAEFEIAWKVLP